MKKFCLSLLLIFVLLTALQSRGNAALLINEVACETSGDDWVEVALIGDDISEYDISPLYVTMYYGVNERLAADPVTLYNRDRPETPYDDRFAVVHLTQPVSADETDLTGDTNGNGRIDVYCNNYSGSLWNSDCVVAIDSDDDPSNGGMIDFMAYSNRDGSVNETIASYVAKAQSCGQWEPYTGENIQLCMADTGASGIASYMSISRKNSADSNSMADFGVTSFQTPGRANVFPDGQTRSRKLFSVKKKKITIIPSHPVLGSGDIDLTVYECCNIRFRIFTTVGLMIYESPLYRNVFPGLFTLRWDLRGLGRDACTGMYLGLVEATSPSLKRSDTEHLYIILSRYR